MRIARLDPEKFYIAENFYLREDRYFPIIAAVLGRLQEGEVFANDACVPCSFFVVHKFGFSQTFGEKDNPFLNAVRECVLAGDFLAEKIRLYAPPNSNFFGSRAELSERCQFRLSGWPQEFPSQDDSRGDVVDINAKNVLEVDKALGLNLAQRFWRGYDDFLLYGMGKALLLNGEFCSACYAAAVSGGIAEVDVATLPPHRKRGFGNLVCRAFINECYRRGFVPNWDCFTNNPGSLFLAKSLGFEEYGKPYPFLTVQKIARGDCAHG